MDPTEIATRICNNCKKAIAASNFAIHEVHCAKHLIRCEVCGEAVPKDLKEQHHAEMHTEVECDLCSEPVLPNDLEVHKKDHCQKRPVHCKFCDLDIIFDEYGEHVNVCGSRTDYCELCNQVVMLMDMEKHQLSDCKDCVTSNSQTGKLGGQQSDDFPCYEGEEDDMYGDAPASESQLLSVLFNTALPGISNRSEGSRVRCPCNRPGCPVAILLRNSDSLDNRAIEPGYAATRNHPISYPNRSHDEEAEDAYNGADDGVPDEAKIPCEFCEKLFSMDVLYDHQSLCKKNPDYGYYRRRGNGLTYGSLSDDYTQEAIYPCEYCRHTFTAAELTAHEVRCRQKYDPFGILSQSRSLLEQMAPAAGNVFRQLANYRGQSRARGQSRYSPQNPPGEINYPHSSNYGNNYNDDILSSNDSYRGRYRDSTPSSRTSREEKEGPIVEEPEETLPCEFCFQLFPKDLLTQHQSLCSENDVRRMTPYPDDEALVGTNNSNRKLINQKLPPINKRPSSNLVSSRYSNSVQISPTRPVGNNSDSGNERYNAETSNARSSRQRGIQEVSKKIERFMNR